MPKQLRVGMVGYQFMGKAHSNGYRQAPVFMKLNTVPVMQAICGRNEKALKAVAKQHGWASVETDWRRLVKRDDIDLVDVSTPNNTHAAISIKAAENGKHVFCEKPLAMNLKQAIEMRDACKENKVHSMVAFNYRRVPAIALAKQLIKRGKLGQIFHVRAVYLQEWIIDPTFPLVWRMDKKIAGSGALGDLGAHIIDLAYHLVGEIAGLAAMTSRFIDKRKQGEMAGGLSSKAGRKRGKVTVDDAFAMVCRFKNGAQGTFEATRFAGGRKNHNCIEINGSKGSIVFNLERMNELEFVDLTVPSSEQGFRTLLVTDADHPYMGDNWWPAGHIIGWEHTHTHQIGDLMNAIGRGKDPEPNFADGCKNQAVLDTVEASVKSKAWEAVPKV